MPTYDYRCEACGHTFEEFQSITAPAIRRCPVCGRKRVKRLIGPGAGIIFKGSGFYQTDYRSESYKKAAAKDKGAAGEGKSGGDKAGGDKATEGKPAAVGEGKSKVKAKAKETS
jgi:putative FmdB family regulatory protein